MQAVKATPADPLKHLSPLNSAYGSALKTAVNASTLAGNENVIINDMGENGVSVAFKGDPYSALKKFQKNRKKRSDNLQRASKFNTKLFHLKNPILRALVYSGLYSISRLIPFILIKSRWVYKYNAFNVRLK